MEKNKRIQIFIGILYSMITIMLIFIGYIYTLSFLGAGISAFVAYNAFKSYNKYTKIKK